MAFTLSAFWRLRPYLYHLTASQNLDRIRATQRLECAAQILVSAGRVEVVRAKRPRHLVVDLDGTAIHIRDQGPLYPRNLTLSGGWTFGDFVQHLNEKVFFWPGTTTGPISYGVRHFNRYIDESPVLIRASTHSLFNKNSNEVPLFCQYNSGSPRWANGRPSPRSPRTFCSADEAQFSAARVVEVVIKSNATLPEDSQFARHPDGPWESLL